MAGGGGKQTGTQTTTQKSEPWAAQQPYLNETFSEAQRLYRNSSPDYYPNSTIARQSADTRQSMDMARTAAGGVGGLNAAIGVNDATARGDYLSPDSNPWLAATYQKAADPVVRNFQTAVSPGIDGSAVSAGRYGSGAWNTAQRGAQDSLGKTLGGMATDLYGGNYQTERDRQMGAVANAPNAYGWGFLPAEALGAVGAAQDARSQAELDANVQRWNYEQNLQANKLAQYQQMVQGNYGGTQTSETPIYGNPLGSILGTIMGGAGLVSGFGGLGGLGGLGSLFGRGIGGAGMGVGGSL